MLYIQDRIMVVVCTYVQNIVVLLYRATFSYSCTGQYDSLLCHYPLRGLSHKFYNFIYQSNRCSFPWHRRPHLMYILILLKRHFTIYIKPYSISPYKNMISSGQYHILCKFMSVYFRILTVYSHILSVHFHFLSAYLYTLSGGDQVGIRWR